MNSLTKSYRPVLVIAPGILAGAEKVVLTGLVGLRDAGLNPLMVIIRESRVPHFAEDFQKALPDNIESVFIESTKAFDLNLPKRLKEILKDQQLPILFHTHGFKALIACRLMKGKLPHIHTHHGNTAHTLKVRLYEKLAYLTMRSCNQVVAVSYPMKDLLSSKLLSYKKIVVIENMLSLDNARKIREEKQSANTNKEIIELLFVGRLSPEKGLLLFLKSLALCVSKDRFHLTVLGDGVEKDAINLFIQENNLASQVTLHGFVRDPSSFFTTADVLIMPSLREGLPMTLIESLASGVPVLANDVGAISSLVTHDHNGYFTKDISLSSWDEALNTTLEHYQIWKKNAADEAEAVEERFSLKLWTQKTISIYEGEI